MPTPAYTPTKSPVKNIASFLAYFGIALNVRCTLEQYIAAAIQKLAALVESPTTLKITNAATIAAIATAGAGTITAAQFAGGLITRDCAGAGRADTLDTAALMIAGLGLSANYDERACTIHNISAGAFASTITAGANTTLKGTPTVEQNTVIRLVITRTSATTIAVRQV